MPSESDLTRTWGGGRCCRLRAVRRSQLSICLVKAVPAVIFASSLINISIPMTASDAETTALARTFFLGLVGPADQAAALAAIIVRMEEDLQRLSTFALHLDALEVPPEAQPIFIHQRATLDYGIGAHEFALAWFRRHAATGRAD